jgi:putative endonuclease
MGKHYYVYILTNRRNGVLYTGMTNDLRRRVHEHKSGEGSGFARRYNVDRLVYFEVFADPLSAITREKQIKAGPRRKKVELFESLNPGWKDLYLEL